MAASIPLAILVVVSLSLCEGERLGAYIKHYEPLRYQTKLVHMMHKRSVQDETHFGLQFRAFDRDFILRLRRDTEVFTHDAEITHGDGSPLDFDKDAIIRGEVVGEPGSAVYGTMEDGKFSGKIRGAFDSFYVEPAERYLEAPDFPSVIYKASDVENKGRYGDISEKMAEISDRKRRETSENRPKRATDSQKKRNACTLAIYADHLFTKLFGGKNQAAFKLTQHVIAVQEVYKNAFNTSKLDLYQPYGVTFRVKKMVIYDSSDAPAKYKADNLGIDPLLNLFSNDEGLEHKKVCEAFFFTDRDFEGGILGLAWIGKPGSLGGVCTGQDGKAVSYNTGIVTMKLYKQFTPPKVSEITFAHELGHGFGSQHDPEGACSPGGAKGNYIMYSKATSGDREYNNLFSDCSLKAIRDNVNSKRSSSRYATCFVDASTPICGNRIIEPPEQCDCGDSDSCIKEGNCCNPPGHAQECRLRNLQSIKCSPSQGPCCNNKCDYATESVTCHNKTECMDKATCRGTSYSCPTSLYKSVETECDKSRRVCYQGQCSKSICTKYSMEECQCSGEKELCDLCCKEPGKDSCVSARSLSQLPPKLQSLQKPAGSPCANMHGYCDVFHVCRRVDKSGPLNRLREKFFTVKGLKDLVKEYWWAILLGIIAGIALVALMVFLCSRYTPSSNPIRENKRPAKRVPGRKKPAAEGVRQLKPLNESEHEV